MPPVTTQRKKTEGWFPITGADQMSNAVLTQTRCVCFAPARVHCSAVAFLFGWWVLPAVWSNESTPNEMEQEFHFCRGFICCYSCSKTYSAWSKVWVLNVLPETAGRVSVHVSARWCACQRVSVCVFKSFHVRRSPCAPTVRFCAKRRQMTVGGAALLMSRWKTEGRMRSWRVGWVQRQRLH